MENAQQRITNTTYFLNNTTNEEAIKYMEMYYGKEEYERKMRSYTRALIERKQDEKDKQQKQRANLDELTI